MNRLLLITLVAAGCGDPDESTTTGQPLWPNDQVARTATSGTLDQCHAAAEASDYAGTFTIETSCAGGASAVISVDDVWFEQAVNRPRVNDTLMPATYPALLGSVSVQSGDEFWENAYFYAQCNDTGMFPPPPGGIAFDLAGSESGSWISCYAGIGSDAGEDESCVEFLADSTIMSAGCSVSATPE